MNVGIIGCGLIGRRRAEALGGAATLVACADKEADRANALAAKWKARSSTDWRPIVTAADVDIVIVATPHDSLAEITMAAVAGRQARAGGEARGAAAPNELAPVAAAAAKRGALRARRLQPSLSPRVSQGARAGRRRRARRADVPARALRPRRPRRLRKRMARRSRERSGGGELLDQGVHLIDLARWFLGDFVEVDGLAAHLFLGHAGRRQRVPACCAPRSSRSRCCTPAARNGRTRSPWRSTAATASSRSTASAAATASSG